MNLFKRLFSKKEKQQEVKVESCPFCWGYREFGEEKRELGYDKQIDVKNHRDKHIKVGKFMVEHVEGFKKQKRVIERCSKCGGKRIRYKK